MQRKLTDEELGRALRRLERFAEISDSAFRIPFTNIRLGLDALVGFIPIIGDLIGFMMAFYLFAEAHRLGLPANLKFKMLRNSVLDFAMGLLPVLGDVVDIGFRSNLRNVRIIAVYLSSQRQSEDTPTNLLSKTPSQLFVLTLVTSLIILCTAVLAHYLQS